jgi:ribonuclease Z
MGLLSTMHLLGRKNELQLCGPPELKEILDLQMHVGKTTLGYPLKFTPLIAGESQLVYEDNLVTVTSFPLKHRITCWGYRINEKPFRRKINKQALAKYKLPVSWMKRIIDGEDFITESGEIIENRVLTEEPESPKSFAYCSDTMYDERIVPHILGVNLLYHEATFAEDQVKRAKETFHSTGKQAATIAKMAGVSQLVLGHYSARYHTPEIIADQARQIFENTIAGEDGMKIRL